MVDDLRQRLADDVAEFLARGGAIVKIPPVDDHPHAMPVNDAGFTPVLDSDDMVPG